MRRRLSPKTEQGRRKNEREAQAETVTKQRHVLEGIAMGSGEEEIADRRIEGERAAREAAK